MKSKVRPKVPRTTRTADEIAEMASRGKDISAHFTNKFSAVSPVRRVNINVRASHKERAIKPVSKKKAG